MVWGVLGLLVGGVVVLVGGGFGLAMWRRRWLIADLPTSDAAHVFVGMNEVIGTAQPAERPIVAPYSALECVWYRSILEEEQQSDDNSSRWRTVADESSEAPFWVADGTGRVLVRPKGASVDAATRERATHAGRPPRFSSLSLAHTLAGDSPSLSSSVANHRTTEWLIRPDEQIYVLGEATLRTDAVALEFAPSDPLTGMEQRPLLVASGDDRRAARRTGWQAGALLGLTMAGAAALPAAWHAVATARGDGPQPGDPSTIEAAGGAMLVAALLVLAVLPVLYVGRLFNRLVAARNRVQAAWSLIDVHLRRRRDLLPELVAVVQTAGAHEREVHEVVAAARSGPPIPRSTDAPEAAQVEQAEQADMADRRHSRSLLAVVEAYPDLATSENFRRLADQIIDAEDSIAFARTFYNDAVTVQRDLRQRFPGLLFAPLVPVPDGMHFEPDQPAVQSPAEDPPPATR